MSNIRWPAKRIAGVVIAPLLLGWQFIFLSSTLQQPYGSADEAIGSFMGSLIGSSIWWYFVYRLIRYPEKSTIGLSKIFGSKALSGFGKDALAEEQDKKADQ